MREEYQINEISQLNIRTYYITRKFTWTWLPILLPILLDICKFPFNDVLQTTPDSRDMQKKTIYSTNIAATMAIKPAPTFLSLTTFAPPAKVVGLAVAPVAVALIVTFPAE
jgi:hypothetical protein